MERFVLLAMLFLASATTAQALEGAGGGGGQGFTCQLEWAECRCTGGIDSADCKGMRRNCDDPDGAICMPDGKCHCTYSRKKSPTGPTRPSAPAPQRTNP
jgi:hypothetical protein